MNEIDEVLKGEYSEEFDRKRKNRVAVSYYKYGPARKNFGEGRVDAIKTAELCLSAFEKDWMKEQICSTNISIIEEVKKKWNLNR